MFHIALGFFLFPYKLPKSFFKQSCQLCLFQSLIYKEPMDESKYQVGKLLQHFHYSPAFESPLPAFRSCALSAHPSAGEGHRREARVSGRDGFRPCPTLGLRLRSREVVVWVLCFILQSWDSTQKQDLDLVTRESFSTHNSLTQLRTIALHSQHERFKESRVSCC